MKIFKYSLHIFIAFMIMSCTEKQEPLKVEVFETSESGNKLTQLNEFVKGENPLKLIYYLKKNSKLLQVLEVLLQSLQLIY